MTYLLQNIYITILSPVYSLTSRLSDQARTVFIYIICLCFPLFFILRHANILYGRFSLNEAECQLLGALLIFALIVFSINGPLHTVKWNRILLYPLIITGICMIVISFIHSVGSGYRIFGFMLVFLYPCLFFVWNNRADYEKLFVPLSIAACLISILLFLYCGYQSANGDFVILAGNRCAGPLKNANSFSMIGMVSFCAALYLLLTFRKSKLAFLFFSFSLGIGFAIVIMGQSRLSIAVCIISLLTSAFFYLRYCHKSATTIVIIKIILAFNIVLLSLLASQCIIVSQQTHDAASNAIVSNQTSVSESNVSDSVADRFDLEESVDANAFSSNRIEIWKHYPERFNMIGNDFDSLNWFNYAHNNFLEMAFRFGVPIGILYILVELIAGIIALQYLFHNRQKNISLLFPVIVMIMFALESMLDVATLPFGRITPCYFFFAVIPMVDATINKKQ